MPKGDDVPGKVSDETKYWIGLCLALLGVAVFNAGIGATVVLAILARAVAALLCLSLAAFAGVFCLLFGLALIDAAQHGVRQEWEGDCARASREAGRKRP